MRAYPLLEMYITYVSGKVLKLTDGSKADKCTFYLEAETKEEGQDRKRGIETMYDVVIIGLRDGRNLFGI